MAKRITNQSYSGSNEEFLSVCRTLGIAPTARQASKWRKKKGEAYSRRKEARRASPNN